ncbi:hypothetical protein SFRURICE_010484 [Spodoptera frugiperda]|nr:hypothetical protein SFRURICE_010484 [Spodoptera frugiperda]
MNKVRSPTRSGPGVGRSDSQPNLLSGVSQPEFSDTSKVTHRINKRKQLDDNEYIRTELSEMRKQMSEMMTMLKNLTTTQNEFTKKITKDITTIKEQIDGIKSTTDNLTIEQNNIKSDVTSLRNANEITEKKINEISHTVQLLKSEQAQAFSSNETQEDIIAEINERELRSKNIVISGIPEPTSLNKDQRISMDKQEVVNLLKLIDNDYPEPEKIMRLGKYDINKTRPIKAYFKSHEIAKSILRNQNNSKRDNIKIYSDQTPKQQTIKKLNTTTTSKVTDPNEEKITYQVVDNYDSITTSRKSFKFLYANMRSIVKPGKFYELQCVIKAFPSSLHALVLTETWIKSDEEGTRFQIPGYTHYYNYRTGKRGGGVSIFIKNNLQHTLSEEICENYNHYLWIHIENYSLDIGAVYRKPDQSNVKTFLDTYSQQLQTKKRGLNVLLICTKKWSKKTVMNF